ncbi:hypothetical protein ACFL13_00070 [Patescibacteria group bacterium]
MPRTVWPFIFLLIAAGVIYVFPGIYQCLRRLILEDNRDILVVDFNAPPEK